MKGRRILLVDDNDNMLDQMELFLHNQYDLTTAQNGFEALRAAERERPDLIVTDIMMPVMDGIAFLNELRRRPDTASVPVVAITSFAEQTTVKSLLNVGFAAVVAKPIGRADITDAVRRHIEPRPAADAGAAA
jgi:two-component system, chemotaxis family, response regulator PixH